MTGVDLFVDSLGWLGAAMLLVAYGLVSAGRLPGKGAVFQILNLLGSVGLAANSGYHRAWPSAALNLVWMAIGAVALSRMVFPGVRGTRSS